MKSKEWSGEGVPPIGTVCEYYRSECDAWRKCEIVAYYFANLVAIDESIDDLKKAAVCLRSGLFRPIKTPEQIAEEERLHAIDEMIHLAVVPGRKYRHVMSALYDAGYRKTEVKK